MASMPEDGNGNLVGQGSLGPARQFARTYKPDAQTETTDAHVDDDDDDDDDEMVDDKPKTPGRGPTPRWRGRGWNRGGARSARQEPYPTQSRQERESSTAAMPEAEESNTVEPTTWKPDLAIGTPLSLPGEDLSKMELAERNVEAWRARAEYYGWNEAFSQLYNSALEEKSKLDPRDDENTKPISTLDSTRRRAVEDRVKLLRATLDTSEAPCERENVSAAISGYETGTIPWSDRWTLLYAGRVVDTCASYAAFTVDRTERLDRYEAAHGPGFLWYEPPLAGTENENAGPLRALRGTCLSNPAQRRDTTYGMGHYEVEMGFRRRADLAARGGPGATEAQMAAARKRPFFKKATGPDTKATTIFFSTLVDSGASLPVLGKSDLKCLGIDSATYAASTASNINTAGGILRARLYEMDCGVYTTIGRQSLVSANPPVWPAEPRVLGATLPVCVFESSQVTRLSGMLMFHVCYLSSAPGLFRMWMGEDRREVLGASRLPGQLRWSGWLDSPEATRPRGVLPAGNPAMVQRDLGTPRRVMFEHDQVVAGSPKKLMDNQEDPGVNTLWRIPKDLEWADACSGDAGVEMWEIEPRTRQDQKGGQKDDQKDDQKGDTVAGEQQIGANLAKVVQGDVCWVLHNLPAS